MSRNRIAISIRRMVESEASGPIGVAVVGLAIACAAAFAFAVRGCIP